MRIYSIHMARQYKIEKPVTWQLVGSELILLNLDNGRYYGLDEIGRMIFEGLRDGEPEERIVADICTAYDVESVQVAADMDALVTHLESEGLITSTD